MNDTLHDLIDGRRTRAELSAEDNEKLTALEATIEAAVRPLRVTSVPDLSARVMADVVHVRIESSAKDRLMAAVRGLVDLLWVPHPFTVRFRPGYAMAALGVLVLWVATPFSSPSPTPGALVAVGVEAATPQVYVQFRLEAQGAASVALAGSFTGWRPAYEMRETASGTWSILLPLQPGVHDYAFIVDGDQWVADPHALQIDDGFGGSNSRIALPSPPAYAQQS